MYYLVLFLLFLFALTGWLLFIFERRKRVAALLNAARWQKAFLEWKKASEVWQESARVWKDAARIWRETAETYQRSSTNWRDLYLQQEEPGEDEGFIN